MSLRLTLTSSEINAALQDTAHDRWPSLVISYSIPGPGSVWSPASYGPGEEPTNAAYGVLDSAQSAWFADAVSAWDRLIALDINRVADGGSSAGAIRVAFTNIHDYTDNDSSAYAYGPPSASGIVAPFMGDIWLDDALKEFYPEPGGFFYETLLHELGHALGLKHPFDAPTVPEAYDNTRWTVMAYDDYVDSNYRWFEQDASGFHAYYAVIQPETPMPLDVEAIRAIYGASPVATGSDIYRIDDTYPLMRTIVDDGGVDTLDLSDVSFTNDVDLTPGSFSSIAFWSRDDQIAYWKAKFPDHADQIRDLLSGPDTYTGANDVATSRGTVIENVIGSPMADTVQGNSAANSISGGEGSDRLFGSTGNDTIDGGAAGAAGNYLRGDEGDDSLVGGAGFDDANGNMGADTVATGAGSDWCVGGKDNDLLFGGDDADLVYGNLGDDTCGGDAGDDVVRGGQGADSCSGGDGNDYISGDRGDDTVSGGAGADVFHAFADAGLDRVVDFSLAEGDRVQLDPGTGYILEQQGADAVLTMSGARMVLVGVEASTLPPGTIFLA